MRSAFEPSNSQFRCPLWSGVRIHCAAGEPGHRSAQRIVLLSDADNMATNLEALGFDATLEVHDEGETRPVGRRHSLTRGEQGPMAFILPHPGPVIAR